MTDSKKKSVAMDSRFGNASDMDSMDVENEDEAETRSVKRERNMKMFKRVLNCESHYSEALIVRILQVLTSSDEIGDEQVLLGSVTLATVLLNDFSSEKLSTEYAKYLNLEEPRLSSFDENFKIRELQWFKIVIAHGFLQVKIDDAVSSETTFFSFAQLYQHCLTYTKYSYIAYKILHLWLEKKSNIRFWMENDTREIECRLEAIIFSNWDNCISEISRRSSTQIFPAYLKIMAAKYEGYLEMIFDKCIQHLSWQNVTKYTILSEICKISNGLSLVANPDLSSCIFTSLTRNDLKHAGTQLYLTILRKMKGNQWQEIFGQQFFRIANDWESKEELAAIDLLWDQWMKPTLQKFPNIFTYLWQHPSMKTLKLNKMYLEKLGDQQSFELIYEDTNIRKILSARIIHVSETVRLNAFAIISQCNNWKIEEGDEDAFAVVKRFLYFNATASSITMRKGIIENFKILLANIAKSTVNNPAIENQACTFLEWLHKFFMDCFEIGSTYQQKILALNLYGIILNFTTDKSADGVSMKTNKYVSTLKCANDLKLRMIETKTWNYEDRPSALVLLKLAIDEMSDVSEKSTALLIRYFDPNVFTSKDLQVLECEALRLCGSPKYHEVTGGSALLKIFITWKSVNKKSLMLRLLTSASQQLATIKKDILKSVTENSAFYGMLTAILKVFLQSDEILDASTTSGLLDLIIRASHFFISSLTVDETELSSSFKDMNIAIERSIRESEKHVKLEEGKVTPAHQLLISCIWMSLKTCCDVAAEIGCKHDIRKVVRQALNVITDVLLKCRHKGAIEAAGVALAKLTRHLCRGEYEEMVKQRLSGLLRVGENEKINLTRRGAGLTIMFHRMVSSDDRENRPIVHFAMRALLRVLKCTVLAENDDCGTDSTCARHLHFLRSLVADKTLQAQLVQYIEDVCFVCLENLQSPEWTVRNASLQLFGAIVPRLVGQCSPKELDYGIGNSVDYFITHYPKLANDVLEKLTGSANEMDIGRNRCLEDFSKVSEIVPILTLLSKMSTSGCELTDCSSGDYIARGKFIFSKFLSHPVFDVRRIAAKAYAAFVPLVDLRSTLTLIKLQKINWNCDNYNHGQLLAQYYLQCKYDYEIKSTLDEFIIRKHEVVENEVEIASSMQIERASYCLKNECYTLFGSRPANYTMHNMCTFTISALLFTCLKNCCVTAKIGRTKFILENSNTREYTFLQSLLSKKIGALPMIGLAEFLENVIAFNGQFLSCPYTRSFFTEHAKDAEFLMMFAKKSNYSSEDAQLNFLIEHAKSKRVLPGDDSMVQEFSTILDIVKSRLVISAELEQFLSFCDRYLKIEEPEFLTVKKLRNVAYKLKMEVTEINDNLVTSIFHHTDIIFHSNEVNPKFPLVDCLFILVEKLYRNDIIISSEKKERDLIFYGTLFQVNEDIDERELFSERLALLTRAIVGKLDNPVCSRANIHKLWTAFSRSKKDKKSTVKKESANFEKQTKDLNIFIELVESILYNLKTEIKQECPVECSYEQDELFQCDETGLLNLLFYCVQTSKKSAPSEVNDEINEMKEIDCKMAAQYQIHRIVKLDLTDVRCYLRLSAAHYITQKKHAISHL